MQKLWKIVFFPFRWSWILLNFIRKFTVSILVLIFISIVVGVYLQSRHTRFSEGALVIDLTGIVVDKPVANNTLIQLTQDVFGTVHHKIQENSLFDIISILRQAKNDPNVTGLVLSLKNFLGANQASLEYIGKALREFRDSGKPIYAVGENYMQAQYFLATYANKIYLTPQGGVDLHGISVNNLYYKSLLRKLKINSHVFRVGAYKSAVEPLLRDNMSEDVRKADNRWVHQLWSHYLTEAANNRNITPHQLFPKIQDMLIGLRAVKGDTAQYALRHQWVDEVLPNSAIDSALIKIFGKSKHSNTFKSISMYDYQPTTSTQQESKKIAVILVNGAITEGVETAGSVRGDVIAKQINDARLNREIKAILLRVNSPGGSVTASETIRSALSDAREAGKPVVISMGGIAASGGYWISTPANYIISSSNTLTGSIGVFGLVNTLEDSLKEIGIYSDGIATSPLADVSITKKLPLEFAQFMQIRVENIYQNFINLTAQSRHKTLEDVEKIAQGHVWIGTDAKKYGLVDAIGDFDDAVDKAAELAKLKKYQLYWYAAQPNFLDLIFKEIRTSMHLNIINLIRSCITNYAVQTGNISTISDIEDFNDPKNCYALCLYCENIQ